MSYTQAQQEAVKKLHFLFGEWELGDDMLSIEETLFDIVYENKVPWLYMDLNELLGLTNKNFKRPYNKLEFFQPPTEKLLKESQQQGIYLRAGLSDFSQTALVKIFLSLHNCTTLKIPTLHSNKITLHFCKETCTIDVHIYSHKEHVLMVVPFYFPGGDKHWNYINYHDLEYNTIHNSDQVLALIKQAIEKGYIIEV